MVLSSNEESKLKSHAEVVFESAKCSQVYVSTQIPPPPGTVCKYYILYYIIGRLTCTN